jgi:HD-GYP domain-containing protein (c-di-GMP phosphodiesterase class II)
VRCGSRSIARSRSHRSRASYVEAIEELRDIAGTQFDPAVVEALTAFVRERSDSIAA